MAILYRESAFIITLSQSVVSRNISAIDDDCFWVAHVQVVLNSEGLTSQKRLRSIEFVKLNIPLKGYAQDYFILYCNKRRFLIVFKAVFLNVVNTVPISLVPSSTVFMTLINVKVKVKLSLCLTNIALSHEGVWGSGCIDSHFLDLGTSWT
jgi:hypothetical protein